MDTNKKVIELPIEEVLPNRFQPRIKFNEDAINELADSIKEHGVIQPIVVRPVGDKYEIIAGERRYKASTLAGKTTIPAIVTDLDDKNSAEVALIENVQRQNLTPIEEAISYKKILDMGYLNQTTLADKLGKNQSTVANKLRLLELDDEVQEALLDSKISERHARSLLRFSNRDQQILMLNRIINERLTVRKTDEEIDKMLNSQEGNQDIIMPTSTNEALTIDKPLSFENFFKEDSNPSISPVESSNTIIDTIQPYTENTSNPGFIDVDKIVTQAQPITTEEQIKNVDMNTLVPNFNQLAPEPVIETPIVSVEPDSVAPEIAPKKFFDILGESNEEKQIESQPDTGFNFDNLFASVPDSTLIQPAENLETPFGMATPAVGEQIPSTLTIEPQFSSFNNIESIDNSSIMSESHKLPQNALDEVKECISRLKTMGYNIEFDEFDLNDMYQIIVKINK